VKEGVNNLKKYILLFGILALILMIPPAQATLMEIMGDSTSNLVNASEVIGDEIVVELDIKPDTLSSNSKGDWVTCYITPSEGYSVHDVDFASITLGELTALAEFSGIVDKNGDGVYEVMVKFDRGEVIEMLAGSSGQIELTITGMFNDGVTFSGTDTINLRFH
jgi:hypothetical protein